MGEKNLQTWNVEIIPEEMLSGERIGKTFILKWKAGELPREGEFIVTSQDDRIETITFIGIVKVKWDGTYPATVTLFPSKTGKITLHPKNRG